MTRNAYAWIFLIVALQSSCTFFQPSKKEQETLKKIEQIWTLCDDDLASATKECVSMQKAVYTSSEYVRMKYDLLTIRIRDKNYMVASSPDSIKKISQYMEKHGTDIDRMRAFFYMGGIYDDLHDGPHAIECALKALSYAKPHERCDTSTTLRCYSLLSNIYRKLDNPQEAICVSKKGLAFAEQAKYPTCWYAMDIAFSYEKQEDTRNALVYCEKAYRSFLSEKNRLANLPVALEIMYFFAQNNEYGKVDTLAQILKSIPECEHSYNYHFAKASMYEAKDEMDSAITYFTQDISHTPSPWRKQAALSHLFHIHRKRGDYKQATEYAMLYMENKRAIDKTEQLEWTRNAKGMFEYQRNKEKEERLTRGK